MKKPFDRTGAMETPTSTTPSKLWRWVRRALIALCALATVTAIFYRVEYWRGKREWERTRQELETQGAVLDWAAHIPPPVPDEQNVFKAPNMSEWFIGRGPKKNFPKCGTFPEKPPHIYTNAIALITILPLGASAPENTSLVLDYEEETRSQADNIARHIRSTFGSVLVTPRDYLVSVKPLARMAPVRIALRSDVPLSSNQINGFVSNNIPPSLKPLWSRGALRIASNAPNAFRLMTSTGICNATDFLEWSRESDGDLEQIRQALKRPYARMDGNYEQPYEVPIPNFVGIRSLAQDLAQRVQCCLLLGDSDAALRDLTLLNELQGFLEAKPERKPMTLVAAMINVAMKGLYAETIADGLQLHAWNESQLIAIQQQLREVNLPPIVFEAFRWEQAAAPRAFETAEKRYLYSLLTNGQKKKPENRIRALCFSAIPQGWIYQNMATHARLVHNWLRCFDAANGLIKPHETTLAYDHVVKVLDARWARPYTALTSMTVPNLSRATAATARHQTAINQAQIACALERYRLVHQQYPETLEALVPQFAEKIPCDVIGGQPLHYHRTAEDGYTLYSVGWNERDDGGVVSPGIPWDSKERADWVWRTDMTH